MKEYYLAALFPPSNIEMQVLKLRKIIFREAGLSSAMAFPAMIPLFFIPGFFKFKDPINIKKDLGLSFWISCKHYKEYENDFFLEVNPGEELKRFNKNLLKLVSINGDWESSIDWNKIDGFISPFNGFFLFSQKEGKIEPDNDNLLKEISSIRFSNFHIGFMRIRVESSPEKWWENIQWEVYQEIKLKKLPPTG